MTRPEWTRSLSPLGWAVAAGIALVVLAIAGWLITAPGRNAARAARAGADAAFSDGRSKSATEAIKGIDDNRAKADDIKDRVKGSEDAIRTADPAERDAVAMRELCLSPSASGRPECAVFKPRGGNQPR